MAHLDETRPSTVSRRTRSNPTEAPSSLAPLVFWHGSRAWDGPPTVQPGRAKRSEGGPGIYLTTSYRTARSYAKGGGVVQRVSVSPTVHWLEEATLPVEDVRSFLAGRARLPKRTEILADVERNAARTAGRLPPGFIHAEVLVNLMVNYDALKGDNGPALAAFLVDHGIDASHAKNGGDEDWVVLFNPSAILRMDLAPASTVAGDQYDLPRLRRAGR